MSELFKCILFIQFKIMMNVLVHPVEMLVFVTMRSMGTVVLVKQDSLVINVKQVNKRQCAFIISDKF